MREIWRDIKGYEGLYKVSNLGRVKRLKRVIRYISEDKRSRKGNQGVYNSEKVLNEKILKQNISDKGYLCVGSTKDKKQKKFTLHRLVAMNFIPNDKELPEVNHKDGNKHNNFVDNLEWMTGEENIEHAIANGLNDGDRSSKLNDEDKDWIVNNYVCGSRTNGVNAIGKKLGVKPLVVRRFIKSINIV